MGRTADLPEHRTLAATLAAASPPLRIPNSQDRCHFASSSPGAAHAHAATSAASHIWRSAVTSHRTSATR
eukprot:8113741-Pyramimonas_sp.AAC.1